MNENAIFVRGGDFSLILGPTVSTDLASQWLGVWRGWMKVSATWWENRATCLAYSIWFPICIFNSFLWLLVKIAELFRSDPKDAHIRIADICSLDWGYAVVLGVLCYIVKSHAPGFCFHCQKSLYWYQWWSYIHSMGLLNFLHLKCISALKQELANHGTAPKQKLAKTTKATNTL